MEAEGCMSKHWYSFPRSPEAPLALLDIAGEGLVLRARETKSEELLV